MHRGELFIECDVQQENVQTRLTKKPKAPALGEPVDYLFDLCGVHLSSRSDSIDLSHRVSRADVRVEAASACRQSVSRNGAVNPVLAGLCCCAAGPIDGLQLVGRDSNRWSWHRRSGPAAEA
jgi:hypothetical protein